MNRMSSRCYSFHWDGSTYMWPLSVAWVSTQHGDLSVIEVLSNSIIVPSSRRLSALKASVPGKKRWKLGCLL